MREFVNNKTFCKLQIQKKSFAKGVFRNRPNTFISLRFRKKNHISAFYDYFFNGVCAFLSTNFYSVDELELLYRALPISHTHFFLGPAGNHLQIIQKKYSIRCVGQILAETTRDRVLNFPIK